MYNFLTYISFNRTISIFYQEYLKYDLGEYRKYGKLKNKLLLFCDIYLLCYFMLKL
jgi:hypothetical protein